jgi:branched-chain amino acid transport system ATP-binding protein
MSPEETDETMVLIRELARGRTVVLVEHKMKLVMGISDRVTVLHQGQVLAERQPRRDPQQRAGAGDLPRSRAMSLLSLEDLHTCYGEAHILQGVSIAVREGEVVTMVGRNGAGKTTTLLSIMGIARARRGAVKLGGEDITRRETHEIVRRGVGWVPEERRVLPNLTVLENLRLGMMAADRAGAEQRLEEALEYFPRLRERIAQKGRFLSGGEQQMLAIARGLVARPRIMLVDEPIEGLAPLLVQSLTGILREINRRGTTILLVEQTLEVAMALSHRLYVMDQGRIQFEGTPDALRQDPTIQQRFLQL